MAVNVHRWIEENKSSFLPPVCNKLMHGAGQLKVMFVGGPNIRGDYHIEEGEELFYQVKGDMVLKVIEKGKKKDVVIKEGEVYILPSRIPHSPQRFENTVGLVIERDRLPDETDGLRWYTEDAHPLYEEWFHCTDLGVQLKPVIARFMASEQHKTGVPIPGTILETPPIKLEVQKEAGHAFNLKGWVDHHRNDLNMHGKKSLNAVGEFKVEYYFGDRCNNEKHHWAGETWIWQIAGHSSIKLDSGQDVALQHGDSLLVKAGDRFSHSQSGDGEMMIVRVDPLANKH